MVLQRSVESPLSYPLNLNKEDVVWVWNTEKQAWKTCSQPEESPKEDLDLLSNCGSFEFPGSNIQCKRRKVSGNSLIVFPETVCLDELDCNSQRERSACGSGDSVHAPVVGARSVKKDLGHLGELHLRQCDRDLVSCGSPRTRTSNEAKSPDSEPEVSQDDSQSKDVCIAFLRSHGFPLRDGLKRNSVPVPKDIENNNSYQSCEVCGDLGSIADMLLCDGCEEAFHVSCSGVSREVLDADEWYCQSCLKLNGKDAIGSPHVSSRGMRGWSLASRYRLGRIACMLKYPDSHTSKVRIGDSFQAIVPEWHGKTTEYVSRDSDSFGEPIEMDPLETLGLHGCTKANILTPTSVSNWLQCQEVLDDQLNECCRGTICGKWRRAPFSEVQTGDWDCSCALPWDPFHADCNIPQELETEKVLEQLKYVERLKSRLAAAKKRK
ncbi:hypothetical protein LINPERPRIM_LOCUS39145 [Linum perenne]